MWADPMNNGQTVAIEKHSKTEENFSFLSFSRIFGLVSEEGQRRYEIIKKDILA